MPRCWTTVPSVPVRKLEPRHLAGRAERSSDLRLQGRIRPGGLITDLATGTRLGADGPWLMLWWLSGLMRLHRWHGLSRIGEDGAARCGSLHHLGMGVNVPRGC